MTRALRLIVVAALLVVGGWYWIAPRRSYDRFVQAVAFGNAAELEATVDFAVLRMHLREDLRSGLARRAGSGLGADVAGAMLGALVDAAVTPEGLSQIITGFGTRDLTDANADSLTAGTTTRYRYRSPSRVDVQLFPAGRTVEDGGVLTFTRQGLRWRLSRVWSPRLATSRSET